MAEEPETKKIPLNDKNVLNVVLFGETGVGKSTFVNALVNYVKYETLDEALKGKLHAPIPVKFTMMDEKYQERLIEVGENDNERTEPGVSSTQNPKTYLLNIPEKNLNIRLIDTPGIGDTRGLTYDEENMEKILAVLGELHHVNAFCVLLKPNNSRITVFFEYCLKHLLSKLDKKVFDNFVFVFTNARSSFYTPGDTYLPLKMLLEKIAPEPNKIKFDKNNIFCIDNESIRFLAAKSKGVKFNQEVVQEYKESYNMSSSKIKGMINYIKTLNPVSMMDTLSINDARRIIYKLAAPMIEVMEKCEQAKESLLEHERKLLENQNSLKELKSLLYLPVLKYQITEDKVETTTKDPKKYDGFKFSWKPPFISYSFGRVMVTTQKVTTTSIYTPHIVYEEAANIKPLVDEKEQAKQTMTELIKRLKESSKEYEDEGNEIFNAIVKFRVFLKENAFLMGNDIFRNYLVNLIHKERRINLNKRRLENYENLLGSYLEKINEVSGVTPQEVGEIKTNLLQQKHFGVYLKYFYELQPETIDTVMD